MRELETVIGEVVLSRRKRQRLTQEALAEATGLHHTYIGLIERGLRCPSARVLIALAEGLDTTAASLMASVERELAKAKSAKRPAPKKRVPRKRSTRR
ncbi:MAG: helix-turn-helix domain-containing protein [Candidatus Hydrogenedens sp.]|nr:helix-turn-helix domain-containing protein [Candidatus Hydrogenedens sp.]